MSRIKFSGNDWNKKLIKIGQNEQKKMNFNNNKFYLKRFCKYLGE